MRLGIPPAKAHILFYNLNEVLYVKDNEFYEMIEKLIKHALTGESTKFELLRSWREYKYYKSIIKSYKSVLAGLKPGANRLYNSYCDDVASGKGTASKVTAYKQMLDVLNFYENEISTISDMVREYQLYLFDGHFIASFFGEQRDYRNLVNYLEERDNNG